MKIKSLSSTLKEKPFTLALSSSFFGFFAHAGIIQALRESGIKPSKITGSSAGAIIGGAWASGMDTESIKNLLFSLNKNDFWDPGFGFGFLKGNKFLTLIKNHYPSAFHETKIPFEAVAFDLFSCKTRFLSDGPLPEAIVASCAVPVMFHPVKIGKRYYIDGGVFHKSAIPPGRDSIFCIYLQNDGLNGIYEQKKDFKKIQSHHKVLTFNRLPKVSHNNLENGRIAFSEAYLRMKKSLNRPFTGKINEAIL